MNIGRSWSKRTLELKVEQVLSQRHAQIHFMNYNRNPIDCAGKESLPESTILAGQVLW